ncbi:mRNA splicing protein [Elasticomyces elasticus]|nr:mRNA splicing protein [Elasticomyces elasticus]
MSRTSLASSLPKPRYTGVEEELPAHAQSKGARIVGADALDSTQIVLKQPGPPPYGQRSGWRPRAPEDFGDGGAFPEIPVAQYPLDMGRKNASSSSALAIQVDGEGKVKYDAIARRGHSENRIIHASFKDLIPLRQRADVGEISLSRPSEEEVAATTERTKAALAALTGVAIAAQKPKNVKGISRRDPTFVKYTPTNQMGDKVKRQDRIMKIVERQQDPMEPPKFKHKKIPRGPPSPPAPVMHSPPRKLTAEDQEAWKIPPPVSNWKNPKGYTVPLDKRLAADGRGLQDVTINDKFAQFSEALSTADRHAREEVRSRAMMQQKLAEKEKLAKEQQLQELARKAREERSAAARRRSSAGDRSPDDRTSRARSTSRYSSASRSSSADSEELDRREREKQRTENRQQNQREMRQKNMGHERKMQMLAREQNRDISEKVALGLAKPTQSKESMYDSRLFNQSSGFAAGFNEDQPYDRALFADRDAINSIYRPGVGDDVDEGEDGGETYELITKTSRFEGLGGKGKEVAQVGFPSHLVYAVSRRRTDDKLQAREGPVQFEKDSDVFGIEKSLDAMINEEKAKGSGGGSKRYGIDEPEDHKAKKARVDDE